jgi:phenylacetate-CoA ligase
MRNLEPNYKIDTIITAFAILKKHYPHALLIIAGFGSEEIRLRNLSASLKIDGISFVGRVEPQSVPALYDRADIFVNAAVIDNQPVSVLEAFAAGLPVVSTGTGDIAAMVCHGQAGVIVPQTDPDAMAGAIERLLDNPEQTVAMANYARNEVNLYTWKNIRYQWAAIYMSEVT